MKMGRWFTVVEGQGAQGGMKPMVQNQPDLWIWLL